MIPSALFFDIDGTLVSFKTHRIPQSAVDALGQAKERGMKVYISTGRPPQFIINLSRIKNLIDGYITTNGGLCLSLRPNRQACDAATDSGESSMVSLMGKRFHAFNIHHVLQEDVERVFRVCDKYGKPCIVVGTEHVGVYQHQAIVDEVFGEGLGLSDFNFSELEVVLQEPILQLSPFISEGEEAELSPTLTACNSGRWTSFFTDITHINADKGKGLQALVARDGLRMEEAVAFGDGGNDIPILREAGIGVAMGNAADEVKAAADHVTSSVDDDGLWQALRHLRIIE